MASRDSKSEIKKDIGFIEEILENAEKWREGNDWSAADMVFELLSDWKDELKSKLKGEE